MTSAAHARNGEFTGVEVVSAVDARLISVTEAAAACAERARCLDGDIGAFRFLDWPGVSLRARGLDDAAAGALRGLIVGVKDVIDTEDMPTSYGSPLFADYQPAADAAVVRRLKRAGALILGKTETSEFGIGRPSRTRNPASPGRTPGASSGGSAAAVASGMVPVALGVQTAGSVIRPAAYCGVYGFCPTRGWLPTDGIWTLAESLDTIGLFARSAADLSLVYRALTAGAPAPKPAARRHLARLSCALLHGSEWSSSDAAVHAALSDAARRLTASGWDVRPIAMPENWRALPASHEIVMTFEVARNMVAALRRDMSKVSSTARAMIEEGAACAPARYRTARTAERRALADLRQLARRFDLILAPSTTGVAPEGLEDTGDPVMCRPWALLGLPSANLPGYRRQDGLPVGIQVIGTRFDNDEFLLSLRSVDHSMRAGEAI